MQNVKDNLIISRTMTSMWPSVLVIQKIKCLCCVKICTSYSAYKNHKKDVVQGESILQNKTVYNSKECAASNSNECAAEK